MKFRLTELKDESDESFHSKVLKRFQKIHSNNLHIWPDVVGLHLSFFVLKCPADQVIMKHTHSAHNCWWRHGLFSSYLPGNAIDYLVTSPRVPPGGDLLPFLQFTITTVRLVTANLIDPILVGEICMGESGRRNGAGRRRPNSSLFFIVWWAQLNIVIGNVICYAHLVAVNIAHFLPAAWDDVKRPHGHDLDFIWLRKNVGRF